MPTRLLYQEDDHTTNFEATVLEVDRDSRTLVLDRTAFFPTGGHQHCDQGFVEKNPWTYVVVTEVEKTESGEVVHRFVASKGSLEAGDTVRGRIEVDRRRQHMQLHTAQHVLSRIAADRFGIETGRADFGPRGGLVVTSTPLSQEQMLLLEDDVNRVIEDARPVTRRVGNDGVATIEIAELDRSRCCGTHVKSTAEIGMFKFRQVDGRVMHYDVGARAQRLARRIANHALEASARLGLRNTRDLADSVQDILAQREHAEQALEQAKHETTTRNVSIANQTAETLAGDIRVFCVDLSHLNAKAARELLKRDLTRPGQIWLCLANRRNLLVSSGTEMVAAGRIVEEFTGRWQIRGGGNSIFAQGGPIPDTVRTPLAQVARWLGDANDIEVAKIDCRRHGTTATGS